MTAFTFEFCLILVRRKQMWTKLSTKMSSLLRVEERPRIFVDECSAERRVEGGVKARDEEIV